MVFFIMAVVIVTFFVLYNFDLHKLLHVKSISQNGGDAAALMAARWQAITLNLVGDLNIMQALALSAEDRDAADAINGVQARLAYTGPMIALAASQQAAKNNGIFVHDEFSAYLAEHARVVREEYTAPVGPGGEMLFPEPWPGAWSQYADMLDLVAEEGVAAAPDNMRLYTDSTGGHTLLRTDFYDAIAGRNWCWFYHNEPTLLGDYENFFPCWWPALPTVTDRHFINSEIYGLGLRKSVTSLDRFIDAAQANATAVERGFSGSVNATGMLAEATWYCYDDSLWTSWDAIAIDGEWPFPLTGAVRPQYDYQGADVAVRVETSTGRLTPGPHASLTTNTITWTAAAKPFGSIDDATRPDVFDLVLPAFRDVRLIPIDASSAPSGGAYNLAWRRHVELHLPVYMESGPGALSGCWYCTQLRTWENPAFRLEGLDWLSRYSSRCIPTGGGGGGGPGGGRRRGH
jgi:hypothetical protein